MQKRVENDVPLLDAAFVEKARTLRPFYFMVVVWGERYTDFLFDYCVASLLSPNNIPALLNRGNKFLIATTDEDRARMQGRPMLELLAQYCEIVFVPTPPCPPGESHCVHMGIGHKALTDMAFKDRAYGVVLTPDMMNSDGTVATMQRCAVEGYEVMLTAALRFGEEPLFEHLQQIKVLPETLPQGDRTQPIIATGRLLAWAGLRSFHSETLTYEWDQPYFANFPSAVWWRVPGEDGIIVHSLSWAPMLFDYGAIERHDSSVMEEWTIDGDYIHKNFGLKGKVYVVQDSDEVMQISWAPLKDREQLLKPNPDYLKRFTGQWHKGEVFYKALSSPAVDPLKKSIFHKPVYWHAHDMAGKKEWARVERKARLTLRTYGFRTGISGIGVKSLIASGAYANLIGAFIGESQRFLFKNYQDILTLSILIKIRSALENSNDISGAWGNHPKLARTNPVYNRAFNESRQRHGDIKDIDQINAYILSGMAELDPHWDIGRKRVVKTFGWLIKPVVSIAKIFRIYLKAGRYVLQKLRLA